MWIDPISARESDEGILILTCPNAFSCRRIQENYGTLIEQEVLKYGGKACRFVVKNGHKAEHNAHEIVSGRQMTFKELAIRPTAGRFLHKDYTFDQCLYDYRISMLHSLARQVIVVGGGFVAADQERKLCDFIVPPYIAAVLDLDADELLPP